MISEELLLGTVIAGIVLILVLVASRPRAVLGNKALATIKPLAGGLGTAAAVTAVIAGYPLWVQFFGPLYQSGSPFTLDWYKNDLSSLVVPSSFLLFHTGASAAEAARFQGHLPEYLGYLGWPLIVVLVAAAAACWRRLPARAVAVTAAILLVFSLGGTLMFGGHEHHAIKLPWYWLQGLPVLSAALPDRFSIVADGMAAALLAFAVDAAIPAVARLASRSPLPRRRPLAPLARGWPAAGRGGDVLRGAGRAAGHAPAPARGQGDSAAGRLDHGARRAAAAGLGPRAGGAAADVDVHRAAALAGRHRRAPLPGRRATSWARMPRAAATSTGKERPRRACT